MRSTAVATSLLILSAVVNTISITEHGHDARDLDSSHSSPLFGAVEVRAPDERPIGDELEVWTDDMELSMEDTSPNPEKFLEKRRGGGRGGGGGGRSSGSGRSSGGGGGSTRTGGYVSPLQKVKKVTTH